MIKVSDEFIGALLGSLLGVDSPYTEQDLLNMDPNNQESVRALIQQEIKPFYLEYSKESQQKIKESLRWLLNVGNEQLYSPTGSPIGTWFERIFLENGFALALPNEPVDFYKLLWCELFGSEDYVLKDLNNYSRCDDEEFINNLR